MRRTPSRSRVTLGTIPFLLLLAAMPALAQLKEYRGKLSATLAANLINADAQRKTRFRITLSGKDLPPELIKPGYEARKIRQDQLFTFIIITCTKEQLLRHILPLSAVRFAEDALRVPREELLISDLDPSVNRINMAHSKFPRYSGNAITVSVKENLPDTTDIDIAGRFVATNLSSSTISSHATIMCTMIAGGGNSWILGRGAAWGSTITSSNFANLLPDADSAYKRYNISVQNNSYGVGVESYYGSDAAAYDASAIDNPGLLQIFSAGNAGTSPPPTGTYAGLKGFANLTGSFKMAKNILTVGATDSFSIVPAASSKGPAHDGRVKPELVAYGEDGSSGAAALVSGTALLLQDAYRQLHGSLPDNALLRALLINSADDIGSPEVDYASGFGALNAYQAMQTLQNNRFLKGSVTNGNEQLFYIAVPPGIKKCKITLVWNDPPASPNAARALVNDLDVELLYPSSGASWLPWVLNPFPQQDSLRAPAARKRDSINNIEQITVQDPLAGIYQVKVKGYNVTTSSQTFFVAYQFDSSNIFEWQYPVAGDFLFPSAPNTVRWKSSFSTSTGSLELSVDSGNTWQSIAANLDLVTGYYKWNAPSFAGAAWLRMTVDSNRFVSDAFIISPKISAGTGFNCPDSFLIYWNRIPAATGYRIFNMGSRYLEPLSTTTTNFVVLDKPNHPSLQYAVAPIFGSREGAKSHTFNYTTQGVECYIRSFLASLANNTAQLTLTLGTLYNISRMVLEKSNGAGYTVLQQLPAPSGLTVNFADNGLTKGLNTYRVKLELSGGGTIYSSTETVYYFAGSEYIVFPNPVHSNELINYLSNDLLHTTTLQVFNVLGQKLAEQVMDDVKGQISAGRLRTGFYLFRFVRSGKKDVVLKVVVQ